MANTEIKFWSEMSNKANAGDNDVLLLGDSSDRPNPKYITAVQFKAPLTAAISTVTTDLSNLSLYVKDLNNPLSVDSRLLALKQSVVNIENTINIIPPNVNSLEVIFSSGDTTKVVDNLTYQYFLLRGLSNLYNDVPKNTVNLQLQTNVDTSKVLYAVFGDGAYKGGISTFNVLSNSGTVLYTYNGVINTGMQFVLTPAADGSYYTANITNRDSVYQFPLQKEYNGEQSIISVNGGMFKSTTGTVSAVKDGLDLTFDLNVPEATPTQKGVMTTARIVALENQVQGITSIGGKDTGVRADTYAILMATAVPTTAAVGDYAYVRSDEQHGGSLTRYTVNASRQWQFDFVVDGAAGLPFGVNIQGEIVGAPDNIELADGKITPYGNIGLAQVVGWTNLRGKRLYAANGASLFGGQSDIGTQWTLFSNAANFEAPDVNAMRVFAKPRMNPLQTSQSSYDALPIIDGTSLKHADNMTHPKYSGIYQNTGGSNNGFPDSLSIFELDVVSYKLSGSNDVYRHQRVKDIGTNSALMGREFIRYGVPNFWGEWKEIGGSSSQTKPTIVTSTGGTVTVTKTENTNDTTFNVEVPASTVQNAVNVTSSDNSLTVTSAVASGVKTFDVKMPSVVGGGGGGGGIVAGTASAFFGIIPTSYSASSYSSGGSISTSVTANNYYNVSVASTNSVTVIARIYHACGTANKIIGVSGVKAAIYVADVYHGANMVKIAETGSAYVATPSYGTCIAALTNPVVFDKSKFYFIVFGVSGSSGSTSFQIYSSPFGYSISSYPTYYLSGDLSGGGLYPSSIAGVTASFPTGVSGTPFLYLS